MTHTRTQVLARFVCALFTATLLAVGVRAGQGPEQPANDLRDIRVILGDIQKQLANQHTNTELVLDILRKDLKDTRDDVARLQRELADVRSHLNNPTSTSLYGGSASTSQSIAVPMANIRLVNVHFIDMSAVINGVVYSVAPAQQQVVRVPAGAVNYQVLQIPEPMKMRSLVPNETLTLTLFPR